LVGAESAFCPIALGEKKLLLKLAKDKSEKRKTVKSLIFRIVLFS
jgi:hypothetical protein